MSTFELARDELRPKVVAAAAVPQYQHNEGNKWNKGNNGNTQNNQNNQKKGGNQLNGIGKNQNQNQNQNQKGKGGKGGGQGGPGNWNGNQKLCRFEQNGGTCTKPNCTFKHTKK
jgi:hypothetical protein